MSAQTRRRPNQELAAALKFAMQDPKSREQLKKRLSAVNARFDERDKETTPTAELMRMRMTS